MSAAKKEGIQLLRAMLFIGIVAFHSRVPGTEILWGGVETFFIISAYFLTQRLYRHKEINIPKTFAYRVRRLYPVYGLIIGGAFLIEYVVFKVLAFKDLVIHSLFLQDFNWMITNYKSDMVNLTAHTWTLPIEIMLFLILIVAFQIFNTKFQRKSFCFFMILAAISWRIGTSCIIGNPMLTSLCPIAHMDAFGIGVLLAIYNCEKSRNKNSQSLLGFILMLSGVIMTCFCIKTTSQIFNISFFEAYKSYRTSGNYLNNWFTCNLYLFIDIFSVGLLMMIMDKKDFVNRPLHLLSKIGDISYEGYLIHYPILIVLSHVLKNEFLLFVITLIVTLGLSWILSNCLQYIGKVKNDNTVI